MNLIPTVKYSRKSANDVNIVSPTNHAGTGLGRMEPVDLFQLLPYPSPIWSSAYNKIAPLISVSQIVR